MPPWRTLQCGLAGGSEFETQGSGFGSGFRVGGWATRLGLWTLDFRGVANLS